MRQAHLYACLRLFYQQKKEEMILRKVMIQLGNRVSRRAFQIRQALTNRSGEGFVDTAIKILMAVVIGALVLLRPAGVLDFLFTALGIAVLTDGLYKVQIAVDAKRFGIPTWWLTLALAVAAGLIGLALVFRPWDSARLLTILLGTALLAEGILNLCVAVCTVKIVNHQQPDVIEVTSYEVEDL